MIATDLYSKTFRGSAIMMHDFYKLCQRKTFGELSFSDQLIYAAQMETIRIFLSHITGENNPDLWEEKIAAMSP